MVVLIIYVQQNIGKLPLVNVDVFVFFWKQMCSFSPFFRGLHFESSILRLCLYCLWRFRWPLSLNHWWIFKSSLNKKWVGHYFKYSYTYNRIHAESSLYHMSFYNLIFALVLLNVLTLYSNTRVFFIKHWMIHKW